MLSSLAHVLVVTPVIFFSLHERRLALQHEPLPPTQLPHPARWRPIAAVIGALVLGAAATTAWRYSRQSTASASLGGETVQRLRAGNLQITLLSATGTLHQGRNTFAIEFRSAGGQLVDAGSVHASGNMSMPGMVMSSGLEIQRTSTVGRYQATAEFGMAGAWHMTIDWEGPAGRGSVNFEGAVQ